MTHRLGGEPGRLDSVVAKRLGIPRADVQRAVAAGGVLVDGAVRGKSFRLNGRETIEVTLPSTKGPAPEAGDVPVRYQDADLAVVSKPAGMVTHPAGGRREGTLVNRLLGMGMPLAAGPDPDRPGIVHRLDAGTSGLLVVAKSDRAFRALSRMFRSHEAERVYLALVRGSIEPDEVLIEAPLERRGARVVARATAGRPSATEVRVLERLDRATLAEARPRTGRTHQIRVHLSAAGHPVLGDGAYGGGGDDAKRLGLDRPFLHSWRIAFDHPVSGRRIELEDPLPEALARALEVARGRAPTEAPPGSPRAEASARGRTGRAGS